MVVPRWSLHALASAFLAAMFIPMATATPEIRGTSEATVFVDGSSDWFSFSTGGYSADGSAWTITAPDGRTAAVVRTGTELTNPNAAQTWSLSGQQISGPTGLWTWIGDLDGAAADGTWTIAFDQGFYDSDGSGAAELGYPVVLSVAGRSIEFAYDWLNEASTVQLWNWQEGSWTEPRHPLGTVDSPMEAPAEDPQFARFFASESGPISQSIPGDSESQTIPGQNVNTPPETIPATCTIHECNFETPLGSTPAETIPELCTLDQCTSETPVVTPAEPVPVTCVPPLVPLLCVGPFTVPSEHPGDVPAVCDAAVCLGPLPIPAQDLGTVPAVCDAANEVCVGPFPIPAQHVLSTPVVTVAVDFTGVDAAADPHAGELVPIGPFTQVVPVPIIGDVPVTVCPSTCPFPVQPEGSTLGSLTVTVTVGSDPHSVTVPLSI